MGLRARIMPYWSLVRKRMKGDSNDCTHFCFSSFVKRFGSMALVDSFIVPDVAYSRGLRPFASRMLDHNAGL